MSRRATGLKRPYPIQVDVNETEDEFVSRASYSKGMSKSEFIRNAIFEERDWRDCLKVYRAEQKNIKGIYIKRKARAIRNGHKQRDSIE